MYYRDFLRQLHELLEPKHYLEIGVRAGDSLALARCPAVGIDPAFSINKELDNHITLFRTTSDEYFARPDPLAPTNGERFDLAFIDGLHLFEFALRDFINVERHSRQRGVIVFDDVLPRSIDEAARQRHTGQWTGDVYSIVAVLERYRPDLIVMPVKTRPTGLLLVIGLDPSSTALVENYDEIVREYRRPDPQQVPRALLQRAWVLSPQRLLSEGPWRLLHEPAAGTREWRRRLNSEVRQKLGQALAA